MYLMSVCDDVYLMSNPDCNRWGFKQVDKQDPNGIVFMHHLFVRGEKQLCRTMKSKASTQTKKAAETIGQQQFYANLGMNMQGTMSQQDMLRAMMMMAQQQGGYPMPNQAMMVPNNQAMMMQGQSMPTIQGQEAMNMQGQSMMMPGQASMPMNMMQGQAMMAGQVLPAQGQLTSQPGLQMSQMEQQEQQNQMQLMQSNLQQNRMIAQAFPSSATQVAAAPSTATGIQASSTEEQVPDKTVFELASEIIDRNPGMSQKRALSLAKEINNSEGHKV